MKLRRALSFATLGIGAAAATNALLRRDAGDLPPALDGMQRTYRWRGMNVAYTEAGDPADPDLVLLHGVNAAGSSGEWRAVFEELAESYHVIAPDLPGYGRSDRPPVRYSAALYEAFVESFLGEFGDDEGPAVIASSLSAAYAAEAAQTVPVSRFVLVCPTTTTGPGGGTWVRELVRAPLVGEALFNAVTSKPAIDYFNADHGYADPDGPDEEWAEYEWRTAHQENARFAPAGFLAGDLDTDRDLGATLAALDVPTTIVWGRETEMTPVAEGEALARDAGAELLVFDRAKLLPHVERADAFLNYVLDGELPDDYSVVREYDPSENAEPAVENDADEADAEDAVTSDS
ncbi:acetoin dehydrogenase E2 subunit dihydrolipoyllysine-residue acetyltransferase [Halolamina pelagica]|uniref:Acetoin dehydrogenase E2 subunit dihydrolipoyllysine-residue acetyltransferase n=1 Tax=Halolamina pelagica TaxID=699431 RepID=A0A0P7I1Z5_9EURY|nr:alpha/beta hydrolase [Halolamina pelagica]KPN30810.1 acetoin dehydrogenase E2 subunit dihydrolipoyllysine-residue acetyltransferase [Halolamina pelagica]